MREKGETFYKTRAALKSGGGKSVRTMARALGHCVWHYYWGHRNRHDYKFTKTGAIVWGMNMVLVSQH